MSIHEFAHRALWFLSQYVLTVEDKRLIRIIAYNYPSNNQNLIKQSCYSFYGCPHALNVAFRLRQVFSFGLKSLLRTYVYSWRVWIKSLKKFHFCCLHCLKEDKDTWAWMFIHAVIGKSYESRFSAGWDIKEEKTRSAGFNNNMSDLA